MNVSGCPIGSDGLSALIRRCSRLSSIHLDFPKDENIISQLESLYHNKNNRRITITYSNRILSITNDFQPLLVKRALAMTSSASFQIGGLVVHGENGINSVEYLLPYCSSAAFVRLQVYGETQAHSYGTQSSKPVTTRLYPLIAMAPQLKVPNIFNIISISRSIYLI